MARLTGSLPIAQHQQKNFADVQGKRHSWGNANQSEDLFQIVRSGITDAGERPLKSKRNETDWKFKRGYARPARSCGRYQK